MNYLCAVATVLVAGIAVGQASAAEAVAGYDPAQRDHVAALPLYLVAQQETLRPQYAHLPLLPGQMSQAVIDAYGPAAGLGPALVGGVVAGALVNVMARAESIALSRDNWRWVNAGQCRIDTRTHVEPALLQALQQTGMPAAAQHVLLETSKLQTHFDTEKAHQRITHSSSVTPDFAAVMTTVRVEGWADKGSGRHKPDWVNVLQVLSTPLWLDHKQEHDTVYLKQQLDLWYAGTGNRERIAQVNAAGRSADPALRRQAVSLQSSYSTRQRRITRDGWQPYAMNMIRGLGWGLDDCALLHQALQDNAAEAGRLLQLAYAGQLPGAEQPTQAPPAGLQAQVSVTPSVLFRQEQPRELVQLAPSVHLSQQVGGGIPVGYHHTVVTAEDLAE